MTVGVLEQLDASLSVMECLMTDFLKVYSKTFVRAKNLNVHILAVFFVFSCFRGCRVFKGWKITMKTATVTRVLWVRRWGGWWDRDCTLSISSMTTWCPDWRCSADGAMCSTGEVNREIRQRELRRPWPGFVWRIIELVSSFDKPSSTKIRSEQDGVS